MARVVALIQSRMSSQRLPGKALLDVMGRPVLWRVVHRVRQARLVDRVVVITGDIPANDAIEGLCLEMDCPCYRGSEDDVLDRAYQAAVYHRASIVCRISGDSPLVDPTILDWCIETVRDDHAQYATNTLPGTYPDGTDVEAMRFSCLDIAHRHAKLPSEREHWSQNVRNAHPGFRKANLTHDPDLSAMRWCVDTAADLEFVRAVYDLMGCDLFGVDEVLALLAAHPDLERINAGQVRDEGLMKSLERDRAEGAKR